MRFANLKVATRLALGFSIVVLGALVLAAAGWYGIQRQSDQQPIPITSSLLLRLKGKPLSKGATLSQVLINFDGEGGKSLKKPVYDEKTRTLTLSYPLANYRVIMDLLRNETLYVQFLTYPNGHLWADLHTGTVRTR